MTSNVLSSSPLSSTSFRSDHRVVLGGLVECTVILVWFRFQTIGMAVWWNAQWFESDSGSKRLVWLSGGMHSDSSLIQVPNDWYGWLVECTVIRVDSGFKRLLCASFDCSWCLYKHHMNIRLNLFWSQLICCCFLCVFDLCFIMCVPFQCLTRVPRKKICPVTTAVSWAPLAALCVSVALGIDCKLTNRHVQVGDRDARFSNTGYTLHTDQHTCAGRWPRCVFLKLGIYYTLHFDQHTWTGRILCCGL